MTPKPHLTPDDREQLAALIFEWLEGHGTWASALGRQKNAFRKTADYVISHWKEAAATGEADT